MAMSQTHHWPCQSPGFLSRPDLTEVSESKLFMPQRQLHILSRPRPPSSAYRDVRKGIKALYFPCQPKRHRWYRLRVLPPPLELLRADALLIHLDVSHPIDPLIPQLYARRCLEALKTMGFLQSSPHLPVLLSPQGGTRLHLPQQAESHQRIQCHSIDEAGPRQRTR